MKTTTSNHVPETILVVEDDDKFRTQLAQYLRDDGFQIAEANSGSDACALIRKRKISLVLLDWDLYRYSSSGEDFLTGFEIVRTCREVDGLLPVVAMSGAPGCDARVDSIMAGADGFLQKPFPLPLLSIHLRRWMGRLKAEQNPFTQLTAGVIKTAASVNRAYARAVVEKVGSVLQAAPKLGLSRQTVASYLAFPQSALTD